VSAVYSGTMRALVYTAPGQLEMQEQPRPSALAGDEEIAIQVAGVCGSDISGFLGHSALRKPPLVLGHELVGCRRDGRRVVANPLVSCGHCNACISGAQNLCDSWKLLGLGTTPGTFAEYVTLPSAQVYEVPDSLTSEQAILAEPLANIVHMLRSVAPPPFFRFAIVGAGTMGALALLASLRIGVRDVLAVDVNDERLAIMRQLGACAVVNVSGAEQRRAGEQSRRAWVRCGAGCERKRRGAADGFRSLPARRTGGPARHEYPAQRSEFRNQHSQRASRRDVFRLYSGGFPAFARSADRW
jgi:threonine dehydrogenase-like Zn-dependent dehydrogenase